MPVNPPTLVYPAVSEGLVGLSEEANMVLPVPAGHVLHETAGDLPIPAAG